ncbi:hypothetical protein UB47_21980 [Pseudomonas sp. 5]|nr:hypothetical protein UB47_21980 [Pseudomonas sp. 5]
MHRSDWLIFGIIGAVLVAFIPEVGLLLSGVLVVIVLWKVFGFRDTLVEGNCPACTKALNIDPKQDVIACPICGSCMKVGDQSLTLVDLH